MRGWLLAALAITSCHGLLGLDDVGYRDPGAAGGGGSGGETPTTGGGGETPLDGAPRWVFTVDDAGEEGALQEGVDGVFDASGRAVVVVRYDGTVDLDPPVPPTSTGEPNVLLVTLDDKGSRIRARGYGATKAIDARVTTVDEEIFVAGAYAEPASVSIGGSLLAACTLDLEETDCPDDAYVAKYDRDLDFRWLRSEGPAESNERARAIAALPDGVVVGGDYDAVTSIFNTDLTHENGTDVFIARVIDQGHMSAAPWVKTFNGAGTDELVAVDARGATIALAINLSGATTGFVVHALAPADGEPKWGNAPDFRGSIAVLDVAIAPDETVIVAAALTGSATAADGSALELVGTQDLVIARLDTTGKVTSIWQRPAESVGGASIAIDASGDIAIGGTFTGSLDLGDAHLLDGAAEPRGFVAKLDASGAPRWSRTFAPPGATMGRSTVEAVDVTPDGLVLAVGTFAGQIDFELTPITADPGDGEAGYAAFAMGLGP